jgi:phage shock protein PspC (stress-responsive transcriptional regulator)
LDIGSEYDYRSIIDYFKIIVSWLWVLLWIFIFNFILLRIIYYIILWKFFPKESE